jgi:hypothetical protein
MTRKVRSTASTSYPCPIPRVAPLVGNPDGLYITSAALGPSKEEKEKHVQSGDLFRLKVGAEMRALSAVDMLYGT